MEHRAPTTFASDRPATARTGIRRCLDRIALKDPRRGLIWFGSILVAALAAMAGFVIFELRSVAINDVVNRASVLSQSLAEQTALTLDNIDAAAAALVILASDRTLDQPFRMATLGSALGALAEELPHLHDLFLLDSTGAVVFGARVPPTCRAALRGPADLTPLDRGPRIDPIVVAPPECFGGQPALKLSRILKDRNGDVAGILVSAVRQNYLAQLYPEAGRNSGRVIALFRTDGKLLAHQPQSLADFGRSFADHSGLELLRVGATTVDRDYVTPIGSIASLAAASRVRDYGAVLVVSSPRASILRSWRRETVVIAVAALAASAMILLLTLLLVRQLNQRERTALELLKAKEEAERATRLKSRFLAVLSHELRTPLNAILGFSEILMRETFGPHTTKAYAEYGKDIHTSAGHLLEVINGVLEVARSEAGHQELAEEEIQLGQVVMGCFAMVRDLAAAAGLNLIVEEADRLPRIRTDHRAITQVLVNVLSNAIKFTPRGGTVTVSGAREANGELVLKISDTGVGIAPKDLERLFEPFFQPRSGREREGSGLGLMICRDLMTALGGSIAIASKLNQGTVVTLRLPARSILA